MSSWFIKVTVVAVRYIYGVNGRMNYRRSPYICFLSTNISSGAMWCQWLMLSQRKSIMGLMVLRLIASLGELLAETKPITLADQVAELLRKQPSSAWTVSRLAQALNMSESSLAHRFRAEVGLPPAQWMRRYRIGQAQELLLTHKAHVVASMLGFADQYHFSRVFRQEVGVPPSVWRRDAPYAEI